MCGLAGFLFAHSARRMPQQESEQILRQMGAAIEHRGPDAQGVWTAPEDGIGLVHQRLSILDLTAAGGQPMVSASGRYVLVFNGEIYNHADLRARLQAGGHDGHWNGHSDTETLLAAISLWGLEEALCQAAGMFALALWDKAEKRLFLARDRFGEKPLYYGWQGKAFLFASELKALAPMPEFAPEIDPESVTGFMHYGYVPDPLCIWKGMAKLLPGTWVELSPDTPGQMPEPQQYWSFDQIAAQGRRAPFTGTAQEAADALEQHLRDAIAGQLIADVPVGAFLSGGIDSSVVVSLMQSLSTRRIATFSIGFEEEAFNEAPFAAAVAKHLGTEHTSITATPQDALALVPSLPHIYDEPFGDSSALPTLLVSELAARHVTVVLSGDAGDETFHGYTRYMRTARRWERMRRIPAPLRMGAGWLARGLGTGAPVLGRRSAVMATRLKNMGQYLTVRSEADLYGRSICHWPAFYRERAETDPQTTGTGISAFAHRDMLEYLRGDILTKVDRAAMSHSLETRVPMLDHRLQEFAATLPDEMKMRDGTGKWILREVLHRHVPTALFDRPKKGFGVPLVRWLRADLREWAEELLSADRLSGVGLDPAPVRTAWHQFQTHGVGSADAFWCVLMLSAWHRETRG